MAKKNYITEEILLVDKKFFNDSDEHEYEMKCFDGHAEGTLMDDDDPAPKTVAMTYPKLADVLANDDMAEYVLEYRGLFDLSPKDIHYGDVCMAYGEICKQ